MWTDAKQMEFERADLLKNNQWFTDNWALYQDEMVCHALMTFSVFEWEGFRAWLRDCYYGHAQQLYHIFCMEARKHNLDDV